MDKMLLRIPKRLMFLVTIVSLALLLTLSGSAFADNAGPILKVNSPVPDSSLSSGKVTVSLTATDQDNVKAPSVVMKVDGQKVNPILQYGWFDEWTDDFTTLDMYYSAQFVNGSHTIEVSASDNLGNVSSTSWTFTVGHPPRISGLTPPDGSVITESRPVISANIYAGSPVNEQSIVMAVNGEKVPVYFDPISGKVTSFPPDDLANETVHTVSLYAADSSGNAQQTEWRFTVNTYSEMPVAVDDISCQKCHSRAEHPVNNCSKCHGINQDEANPVYPIDDCYKCHNNTDTYPAGYHDYGLPVAVAPDHPVRITDSCVACHASAWESGIPEYHSVSNTAERHLTTSTGCQECHAKSLTREHQGRTDAAGNPMNCYSCHNSTDNSVQNAISTGNSACTACHNLGADGGHPAHSSGLDSNCQTCHSGSILTEKVFHQKNGCNTCHSETAGDIVKYSINTDNTNCFSCHQEGHNVNFVQLVPADIPMFPGYKWSVPQDAVIWAGEPWFDSAYNAAGAKLITSDRLQSVSSSDVSTWYDQKMSDGGWLKGEVRQQEENNFKVTYTKENRMVTVMFFGGETPDPASPFVGYRVQILYK